MDVEKISHTPSSASSDYHMTPINVSDRHTLTELVRTISQRRPASMDRQQSIDKDFSSQHFDVKNDPHLDPGHAHFRLDKWIKMFLADLDENGLKAKRAGILFEKLAVSGSGAALQYQQTVAGMFLAPFEAAKSVFSREKHHKQILHNFNGLLESSELLVVLGRPGSGCSTLLKTLCGEVHGLGIDEDSSITYNGEHGCPTIHVVSNTLRSVAATHDERIQRRRRLQWRSRCAFSAVDRRSDIGIRCIRSHTKLPSSRHVSERICFASRQGRHGCSWA